MARIPSTVFLLNDPDAIQEMFAKAAANLRPKEGRAGAAPREPGPGDSDQNSDTNSDAPSQAQSNATSDSTPSQAAPAPAKSKTAEGTQLQESSNFNAKRRSFNEAAQTIFNELLQEEIAGFVARGGSEQEAMRMLRDNLRIRAELVRRARRRAIEEVSDMPGEPTETAPIQDRRAIAQERRRSAPAAAENFRAESAIRTYGREATRLSEQGEALINSIFGPNPATLDEDIKAERFRIIEDMFADFPTVPQ